MGEGCESPLSDHIFVIGITATKESDLQTEKPSPNTSGNIFYLALGDSPR